MALPRLKALPPPAAIPHSRAPRTDSHATANTGTRCSDSCSGTNTRARRAGPRDRSNAWPYHGPWNDNGCSGNHRLSWNDACARNHRRAGNTDADAWHHTRSRRAHSHAGANTGTRCSHTRTAGHASPRRTCSRSHTTARLTGFGSGTDDRSDKGYGDGEML
jgi:hypothetical protein